MSKLQKMLARLQKVQTFDEADKLIMEYAADKLNKPTFEIPQDLLPSENTGVIVRSMSISSDDRFGSTQIDATVELRLKSSKVLAQDY